MEAPWIQVSVDTQDISSALKQVDHATAIDAEWIEVGTPLLTFAGIDSIGAVGKHAPGKILLADFKALDGVAQYFTRAGELGAEIATVMSVANEASILKAVEVGHSAGVRTQVDMLNTPKNDLAARAKELQDMGADYLLLHLAIDEFMRNPRADPLEGLDELVGATNLPVGPVVFNVEQGVEAVRRGASYLVIGYPLMLMDDAEDQLKSFADSVRSTLR